LYFDIRIYYLKQREFILNFNLSQTKTLKSEEEEIKEPLFFSIDDQNLVNNFLHVTDLRLYKIVKWARNLPCFTSTLVS
jgi:hypothetical protein